jgi:metal-responsive CopG/Arc/MetJ family transcriptional regulator
MKKVGAVSTIQTIQVEVASSMLKAIDRCARKLHFSREKFILTACQHLIGQIDEQELERLYCERLKQPEELEWAEASAKLAGDVLPKEVW